MLEEQPGEERCRLKARAQQGLARAGERGLEMKMGGWKHQAVTPNDDATCFLNADRIESSTETVCTRFVVIATDYWHSHHAQLNIATKAAPRSACKMLGQCGLWVKLVCESGKGRSVGG